jgi:hypothetical protein
MGNVSPALAAETLVLNASEAAAMNCEPSLKSAPPPGKRTPLSLDSKTAAQKNITNERKFNSTCAADRVPAGTA